MNFYHDGVEIGVGQIPSSQDWTFGKIGPKQLQGTHNGCYQMGDLPTNDFHIDKEDKYNGCDDSGGNNDGSGDNNGGAKRGNDVSDDRRFVH